MSIREGLALLENYTLSNSIRILPQRMLKAASSKLSCSGVRRPGEEQAYSSRNFWRVSTLVFPQDS